MEKSEIKIPIPKGSGSDFKTFPIKRSTLWIFAIDIPSRIVSQKMLFGSNTQQKSLPVTFIFQNLY